MADAKNLEELAHPEYWDQRYSNPESEEDTFEWFKSYEKLQSFFSKHLPPTHAEPSIIHLGNGNSVCVDVVWSLDNVLT